MFCSHSNASDWTVESESKAGASYFTVNDSPTLAGEYLPVKNKDEINGFFRGNVNLLNKEGTDLSLYGQYFNSDQFRFGGNLYSPRLKVDVSDNTFYHFLDHDPLINYYIEENPNDPNYQPPPGPAKGAKKRKVWKDDYDPGDDYGIKKNIFDMKVSFDAIKNAHKNLKFYAGFSRQSRTGSAQAIGFTMCAACHIQGERRSIDDTTNDAKGGVVFSTKGNFVTDVGFGYRKFNVTAPDPTYMPDKIFNIYDINTWGPWSDTAYFPMGFTNLTNSQGGKMLYGGKEIPYDNIPEYKKYAPNIEFSIPLSKVANLYINGIYSYTKSDYNDIDVQYAAGGATLSSTPFINRANMLRLLRFMSLNVSFRYEYINTDNYIDEERDALTHAYNNNILWDIGSQTGKDNLTKWYNYALYQLEDSSVDRNVYLAKVEASMPILSRQLLKLSYTYRDIDRDNFEVSNTTEQTFKALLRGRLVKNLRYKITGEYQNIADPFGNKHEVNEDRDYILKNLIGQMGSLQNFKLARRDSVTSEPEDRYLGEFDLTYTPVDKVSFNLNAGYTYNDNDWANDLDEKNYYGNLAVIYTPTPKTSISLSYGYNRDETDTTIWQAANLLHGGMFLTKAYGNYSHRVENVIENHVASLAVFYNLNEKFSLAGTFTYTHARSGFSNPGVGYADGEEIDISDLNKYSKLDYDTYESALGMEYKISKNANLTASASYTSVDDGYGYVFGDQTGGIFAGLIGIKWIF